jgi:hypothetical protein
MEMGKTREQTMATQIDHARVRELTADEWPAFFDAFSRHYAGRPVTVELVDSRGDVPPTTIAKRLPLLGITAEIADGRAGMIEVIVGDSLDANLSHVVRSPVGVRVGQIANGADDLLIIEPAEGPAVWVDFRLDGAAAELGV